MSWLYIAVVLGLVEGITEFIPVSSTGHLVLAGHLMGFTGERAATFEIFIQLGAILAVVAAFPGRFAALADLRRRSGFAGARGIGLLLVTTAPALVLGALLHGFIKTKLFTPLTVAAGLAVGGVWILVTERLRPREATAEVDGITWREALAVGLFQCLSLWPGMSRSACTILGGMWAGLGRTAATQYSFFAAVPVMLAACLYDLAGSLDGLARADILPFAAGFAVSFVAAFAAVRFLVRFVGRHTLAGFGWYRLALAAAVAAALWGRRGI